MSAVEAFVKELSHLLEGRLDKETLEARLRETRAHLRMSAEEVGEAEAIVRFGTPRATARVIVRQARGYGAGSAATLSLGVGLGMATSLIASCLLLEHSPLEPALKAYAWFTFAGARARTTGNRPWASVAGCASLWWREASRAR